MPRKWGDGPEELSQPRFVQFPRKVDDWLHHRAKTDRRSLAWTIREIVVEAYNQAMTPPKREKTSPLPRPTKPR